MSYGQLSNAMVGVCLRSQLRGLRDCRKIALNRELVELLRDRGAELPAIPRKSAIETYDNLNSEVLSEILAILGCSDADYLAEKALIDEKLLRHRNCIAHNGLDPEHDVNNYEGLHEGILKLIARFRDDVENTAATRQLERNPGTV